MTGIRRPWGLSGAVLTLALLAPLAVASAANGPGSRPAPTCPAFDASNFGRSSTTIDNPYWPLVPGTRFTYRGYDQKASVVDIVTVTRNTPTKAGVRTVEVRDQVYEDGVLTEDTLDWYAQDKQGNVWYFGELSTELPSGDQTGSWTAGVDGQPGFIMEAKPKVGDTYCQENAPGVAEDAAQVLSVNTSRSVPFGSYTGNVLQTKEYSLIETHNENKFYTPGVGMLEAISVTGPREDIQLYTVEHGV